MGLFSEASKTYDSLQEYVGKFEEGKTPLAPLYHKEHKIQIGIVLNSQGDLQDIQRFKEELGIIPSSVEAQGRSSSTTAPYPLIDNIKNFVLDKNKQIYLSNLKKWLDYSPSSIELRAIYTYLSKNNIEEDLKKYGIQTRKKDKKGKETFYPDLIGWIIISHGVNIKTWRNNPELIQSFIDYCQHQNEGKKKVLSMISGKEDISINKVPPIPIFQTAKLISFGNEANYKGRFNEVDEALTIGYSDITKSINVLSWLCENQSIFFGDDKSPNRLLCWSPDGIKKTPSILSSLLKNKEELHTKYSDYKEAIEKYINGIREKPIFSSDKVITLILGRATTGRISIKFYNELLYKSFLDNLAKWDEECCWIDFFNKKIRSPSIFDIAKYSSGIGNEFKTEKNASYFLAYQKLIEQKVVGGNIPIDIKNSLVNKCSNLKIYMDSALNVNNLLYITCSVIRKYHFKEKEIKMDLDKNFSDRNYQFGRLLAILEKIEVDALAITDSKRISNAIQMQNMFVNQPAKTTESLIRKLKTAYYPRLLSSKPEVVDYYEKQICEIMNKIGSEGYNDKSLGETYILGYYLQKCDLYSKKNKEEN